MSQGSRFFTDANIRLTTMALAVIAGAGILVLKFYAAQISDSAALRSDALEGTVNVLAALFGLTSVWWSEKPADEDHPYGHGKIEYFAKAFEGGLITLAGFLILIDTIERISLGTELQQIQKGLQLNIIAGAANGLLGALLIAVGKRYRSEVIRADGVHLLTDLATTVGMALGLGLMLWTGWLWIDLVMAVLVALLLLKTGIGLVRQSAGTLLDAENPALIQNIVEHLNEFQVNQLMPQVITVHDLKAQEFGRDKHIDIHLVVPEYLSVHDGHQVAEAFSESLYRVLGNKSLVHTHLDPCERHYCKICPIQDCQVRLHPFEVRSPITRESATRRETRHFLS